MSSVERMNKKQRRTLMQEIARDSDDLLGRMCFDDIDSSSLVDSLRSIIASCTELVDDVLAQETEEAEDYEAADIEASKSS